MARISYKISGSSDNKGFKQAQSGMNSLGGAAKTLKMALGGLAAAFSIRAITRGITDVTAAFAVQQKALAMLQQSVSNNSNLSSKSLNNLIKLSGQLQKTSIFGDEIVQSQMTFLSGLGLTEEQIKNVTTAAIELTSSGVGTLESNVKNLAKTLNGMKGELGETIPEMKNLTVEQLKNGEAIDVVLAKYKGMAETLANTLEGREKQVSNIFGDIKEILGGISAVFKMDTLGKLMPALENIQAWLQDNQARIINFFLNLPQIGALAFNTLSQMMKTIFTLNFWVDYLSILSKMWVEIFKSTFTIIYTVIQAIAKTIWEPLRWGFEMMTYGVQIAFTSIINGIKTGIESAVNFLLSGVNKLISGLNKVRGIFGGSNIAEIGKVQLERTVSPAAMPTGVDTKAIANAWKSVVTTTGTGVSEIANSFSAGMSETGELFGDIFSNFSESLNEVLNQELPENIKAILEPVQTAIANAGAGPEGESSGGGDSGGSSGAAGGGFFEELFEAIRGVVGSFSLVSSIMAALGPILNPLLIIFQGIMSVLQPVIDSLLRPLIGILRIIGIVIGSMLIPVFKMLELPIKLVAGAFVFIYNYALRPFANLVMKLMNTLWDAFRGIINAIIGLINKIPGINISKIGGLNIQYLDKIDMDDVTSAGSEAVGASSTGSSASYSGAKELYINIFFNNSYVNGSAREISMMLRDEIRAAEALGM